MAQEVLEKIKQAEQQADVLVREAQQSARDMIEQAERSCRERERTGEQQGRDHHRQLMDDRRALVAKAIAAEAETEQKRRAEQVAACREKLPQAADMIIQRILADGNR